MTSVDCGHEICVSKRHGHVKDMICPRWGGTHSARRCCPPGWRAATVPACGAQPGCIPGTRHPSRSAAGPGAGSDCRGGSGRLRKAERGAGGQKKRMNESSLAEECRQKELPHVYRAIPHTAGTGKDPRLKEMEAMSEDSFHRVSTLSQL